jgi:hypothetical protein
VTSIIGIVDKSGPLVGWAKRETARCAIRNLDMLAKMVMDGGKEPAEAWLSKIPDFIRDDKAAIGTSVHQLVADEVRGNEINPGGIEVPYMRAWRRFRQHVGVHRFVLSEAMVINLTLGFGGTLDLGAYIDGKLTLLDVKTGNAVYNEVGLQLSGYDMGEFTGDPSSPDLKPLPAWEQYGVVHLQPDDWTLIPIDVNDTTRGGFKAALELHRWSKDMAPWTQGRHIKETV